MYKCQYFPYYKKPDYSFCNSCDIKNKCPIIKKQMRIKILDGLGKLWENMP